MSPEYLPLIYIGISITIAIVAGISDMEGEGTAFICVFWPVILLFFIISSPYWLGIGIKNLSWRLR